MKLLASVLSVALASASHTPHRISYHDLTKGHSSASLLDALTDTGLVSVTNVPHCKKASVLGSLNGCLQQDQTKKVQHTFEDGTVRTTLATHTVPNGVQPLQVQANQQDCDAFVQDAASFRASAAAVTKAFGDRLTEILPMDSQAPLLATEDGYPFPTVADIVENGEHLEHFHSYQKTEESPEETVEWHTDQGFFIVFTPGQFEDTQLSAGFSIQLADGTETPVNFEKEDDMIIMLGDGVNQYINNRIGGGANRKLRATPHAFRMPAADQARVWYGRMVLPPTEAVHPVHEKTFGHMRKLMIDESLGNNNNDESGRHLSLACSSPEQQARQLEETTCEEGSIYCWHRCMISADFNVSESTCATDGLNLVCQNPRDQVSDGDPHGDYYPGCLGSEAVAETPLPLLPGYPVDEAVCTDEAFDEFVKDTGGVMFDHMIYLGHGGYEGLGAYLQYSVIGDKVKARLSYNGLFGYISLGFQGAADLPKNGMHGGTVLMALPGDAYNAVDGLDLDLPANIREYFIDEDGTKSSFRHWSAPVSDVNFVVDEATATARNSDMPYNVQSTECHTALMFEVSGIHDKPFNVNGTDNLMWAGYQKTSYLGRHDRRGILNLDWKTGEHTFLGNDAEELNAVPDSGSSTLFSVSSAAAIVVTSMFMLW